MIFSVNYDFLSKFIKPDSIRIDLKMSNYYKINFDAVAFKPTKQYVVVLLNTDDKEYIVKIKDPIRPQNSATISVDKNSIYTLIWKE
jgi:hypothetical protein